MIERMAAAIAIGDQMPVKPQVHVETVQSTIRIAQQHARPEQRLCVAVTQATVGTLIAIMMGWDVNSVRKLALVFSAAVMATSSVAYSEATVFVPEGAGFAWWTSDLTFLPQAKEDEGVSVADVDRWIAENRGMKVVRATCFMNFVRDDQIVAPDRATHDEIRKILKANPESFDKTLKARTGEQFRVRVGVFEDCVEEAAAPLRYMAVVVTDSSGNIRDFDALDWNFIRLHQASDDKVSVFGCYHCGERRELAWDRGNDRFYYVWTGH